MKKVLSTQKGAGLVEYGLLVGLIAVISIASVLSLGERTRTTFNTVESTLSTQLFRQDETPLPSSPYDLATDKFTFTAATNSFVGLSQQGLYSVDYGTLTDEGGIMTNMVASLYLSSATRRTFYFDNDVRTLIAGRTITCDDGFTRNIDTADFNAYLPFTPDYTAIWWNDAGLHPYIDGQTYSCWLD